jgi:hypothetical protein
MFDQIHHLHARMGTEIALFAVRPKSADYLRPFMVTTSDRLADFFNMALGHLITEVSVHMEAYCISSAKGNSLC